MQRQPKPEDMTVDLRHTHTQTHTQTYLGGAAIHSARESIYRVRGLELLIAASCEGFQRSACNLIGCIYMTISYMYIYISCIGMYNNDVGNKFLKSKGTPTSANPPLEHRYCTYLLFYHPITPTHLVRNPPIHPSHTTIRSATHPSTHAATQPLYPMKFLNGT
jgi:hypothetical protein